MVLLSLRFLPVLRVRLRAPTMMVHDSPHYCCEDCSRGDVQCPCGRLMTKAHRVRCLRTAHINCQEHICLYCFENHVCEQQSESGEDDEDLGLPPPPSFDAPRYCTVATVEAAVGAGCGSGYSWLQTDQKVELRLNKIVPGGGSAWKRMEPIFGLDTLVVKVDTCVVMEIGPLHGVVVPSDCFWTVEDGDLVVTLIKHCERLWPRLLELSQ